jgi:hypothetical protein
MNVIGLSRKDMKRNGKTKEQGERGYDVSGTDHGNLRQAVDNPHTHQEMPVEPVMETLAPTVDTFTGNQLRMMVPIVPDQYT